METSIVYAPATLHRCAVDTDTTSAAVANGPFILIACGLTALAPAERTQFTIQCRGRAMSAGEVVAFVTEWRGSVAATGQAAGNAAAP